MGLVAVPVMTGTTPTFGRPEPLFNPGRYMSSPGRDYDVAPKSGRFIFASALVNGGGHIVVVNNWLEELRRLVPTN